jgi:hypothetical protein
MSPGPKTPLMRGFAIVISVTGFVGLAATQHAQVASQASVNRIHI